MVVPTRLGRWWNVSCSLWLMITTLLRSGLRPLLFLLPVWERGFACDEDCAERAVAGGGYAWY